jgi:hypothetical protein
LRSSSRPGPSLRGPPRLSSNPAASLFVLPNPPPSLPQPPPTRARSGASSSSTPPPPAAVIPLQLQEPVEQALLAQRISGSSWHSNLIMRSILFLCSCALPVGCRCWLLDVQLRNRVYQFQTEMYALQ